MAPPGLLPLVQWFLSRVMLRLAERCYHEVLLLRLSLTVAQSVRRPQSSLGFSGFPRTAYAAYGTTAVAPHPLFSV